MRDACLYMTKERKKIKTTNKHGKRALVRRERIIKETKSEK